MKKIELEYSNYASYSTKNQISDLISDFFSSSRIPRNVDTEGMLTDLLQPVYVERMITASEFELPALTFVAAELEKKYGKCANAPLSHDDKNQNAVHRQNIGRMVRYVMDVFGYEPVDGKKSERARLPKFSKNEHFSTSAVYARKKIPVLEDKQ
jgi:hypothetical protein